METECTQSKQGLHQINNIGRILSPYIREAPLLEVMSALTQTSWKQNVVHLFQLPIACIRLFSKTQNVNKYHQQKQCAKSLLKIVKAYYK